MQRHLPEKTLVLYDLGLSSRDVLTLKKACNCSIRVFEFDKYPAHVSTLKLKAYRPIIIQVYHCVILGANLYIAKTART